MRGIVIFATFLAVTVARPDIGLDIRKGYQYQTPSHGAAQAQSGSFGGSGSLSGHRPAGGATGTGYSGQTASRQGFGTQGQSGQGLGTQGQSGQAFGSQGQSGQAFGTQGQSGQAFGTPGQSGQAFGSQGQSGQAFGSQGQSGQAFGTPGQSGQAFGSQGQSGQAFGTPGQSGQRFGDASGSISSAQTSGVTQGQSHVLNLGGTSSGQNVIYKPVIRQGEPIITKHFYVHAAPEDAEDVRVEEKIQYVRPQKTYKIIFIKAPSSGSSYNANNYPIFPQNEEKTIVYVLSKKEDSLSDTGEIPTPPPTIPSKPEVFFIKYRTKEDAVKAVADIQAGFGQTGSIGGSDIRIIGDSGSADGGSILDTFGGDSGSVLGFGSGASSGASSGAFGGDSGSVSGFGTGSSSGAFGGSSSGFGGDSGSDSGIGGGAFGGDSGSDTGFGLNDDGTDQESSDFSTGSSSSLKSGGGNFGSSVRLNTFGSSNGGFGSGSGSVSGSISNVPQTLIRIDEQKSTFSSGQKQNYLPPNQYRH